MRPMGVALQRQTNSDTVAAKKRSYPLKSSVTSLHGRSERHSRGCVGGQVGFVAWLAQMVAAMPSILGDHSRIKTDRRWRWCRIAPPPRRVRANHCALRLCRSRLFALTLGG